MKINKNVLLFFSLIVIAILFIIQPALAQNFPDISNKNDHKYEGDYYFKDGNYFSGGPFDEVKGLLFMDPINLSRGGVFKEVSKTVFKSALFDSTQLRFDFDKNGEVKGLWWKEKGKDSLYATRKHPFTAKAVEFKNGDVTLSGELYLPKTRGPHPAIINVHGSGKETRHMGTWNTVFAKYGIAVLAYDKRGSGKSTGDFSTAGYKDFASDVLAAVKFLKQRPDIDNSKIGLHGSSEGGWVCSIAASESKDISFMMVRVGSGVSGSDTYMYEIKNDLHREGITGKVFTQDIRFERTIQDMAAEGKSLEEVDAYIKKTRKENKWFSKIYGSYDHMRPDYWIKVKKQGPIDPVKYLHKVSNIPVLWFLAEKDENVPYEISKIRLKNAFQEAGNKDFELVSIPDAKHSFLITEPDGTVKYAQGYWNKMIKWLQKHNIATK